MFSGQNETLYRGFRVLEDTYPCIYDPSNKYARPNGLVNIHILQAVAILGRDLSTNEVVHHVDENKWNYNFDNLWIFRSSADHASFHRGNPVAQTDEGIYYCPSVDLPNRCIDCGKLLKYSNCKHTKRCKPCYFKFLNTNSARIDKNRLKELLLCRNFLKMASVCGVTDNAIRKWCKYYGLPCKTSEIKKMTDAEILSL